MSEDARYEDVHPINNDWIASKMEKQFRYELHPPKCACYACALDAHEWEQLSDQIIAHGLGVRWGDGGKYGV